MNAVELKGIEKRFGDVRAVDGISLSVVRGETLAVLGPSGCGKTTLLRIIAGLEPPDSGRVWIDGADVTRRPPEGRGVGLVFQSHALFPHMSVGGNVAYGLRHVGRSARRERVRELLSLVGLEGYARRRPFQLSEGQKQRVALARALAPRPKVLLLDEPLSSLDAALRKELRTELRRLLLDLEVTAVHVTHDQEEAMALADRVAVMRVGAIEQVEVPEHLYRHPATVFVARFLGRANLWPARVVASEGGRAIVEVEGAEFTVAPPSDHTEDSFLFFRPEEARIGSGPYEAIVTDVEYLGERWEVRAAFHGLPLVLFSDRPAAPGERVLFELSAAPRLLPVGPRAEG